MRLLRLLRSGRPGRTIAARDAPLRLVWEDTFAEGLEVDAVRVYGRTDPRTQGRW